MAIQIRRYEEPAPKKAEAPKPPEKRGRGRPSSGKELVTLRISSAVLAHYRATGHGWQARINDALRKAVGL